MSYNNENRPKDSPARGQRNPYAPDDAARNSYSRNGYSGSYDPRWQQGGTVPSGARQTSRNGYESRPFVLSPRGVSQRDAAGRRIDPWAVVAVIASALALILAIILIIVLNSRKSGGSEAAVPAQTSSVLPTQAAVPYPAASPGSTTPPSSTTPSSGFIVITPAPSPATDPAPIQTPIQASTPRPNQIHTPSPGKSYTRQEVLTLVEAAAESITGYATVSDKDVELEVPEESAFLRSPFLKRVNAGESGRAIYIMPRSTPGNGVLGTLYHGTQVTVLAETEFYYFFITQDGRAGWNGKSYFMDP